MNMRCDILITQDGMRSKNAKEKRSANADLSKSQYFQGIFVRDASPLRRKGSAVLHTQEVDGSSPLVSTKKDTTYLVVSFAVLGRNNAAFPGVF